MRQHSHTPNSIWRKSSRRDVLKWSGKAVAASALAGVGIPAVHAAEDNTIRLALIGCGGRGCGAAANAFDSPNGPVKLVAMADFFENRLVPFPVSEFRTFHMLRPLSSENDDTISNLPN